MFLTMFPLKLLKWYVVYVMLCIHPYILFIYIYMHKNVCITSVCVCSCVCVCICERALCKIIFVVQLFIGELG